jgi:hypothetical protein
MSHAHIPSSSSPNIPTASEKRRYERKRTSARANTASNDQANPCQATKLLERRPYVQTPTKSGSPRLSGDPTTPSSDMNSSATIFRTGSNIAWGKFPSPLKHLSGDPLAQPGVRGRRDETRERDNAKARADEVKSPPASPQ